MFVRSIEGPVGPVAPSPRICLIIISELLAGAVVNVSVVPESVYSSDKFRFMKISESERIPIISPRQYKKFEMKKNRKSQKTNLFKSY